MEFAGDDYTGSSESQHFAPPLFKGSKTILVLDYDGLIMLHKLGHRNGARTGQMRDAYHNQAQQVVEHAVKYFDKVVFWSATNEEVLTNMDSFPFNQAHLRIRGAQFSGNDGRLVKNLELLTTDLDNLVAMEDEPSRIEVDGETGMPFVGFAPRERVIEVGAHEDFMKQYRLAFKIFGKKHN